MNYQSTADLANSIRRNLYKLPRDIELIVGIPRSGMLAANIIALNLNLKLTDVAGFVGDLPLTHGQTRQVRFPDIIKPSDASHVLVVDDSIYSGGSLRKNKELIAQFVTNKKVTYCAIYAAPHSIDMVDIYFENIPQPRMFEWNIMHRPSLSECCIDIDGVLCIDPSNEENDDGIAYIHFLTNARPLVIPSYKIGHLVTSRLEKYRAETKIWLQQHGIEYDQLHMLDLPNAETRRRLGNHGKFKAGVYRKIENAKLFIESDPHQAMEIASTSGKPALSFTTQQMFQPGVSYALMENRTIAFKKSAKRRILRAVKRLFD